MQIPQETIETIRERIDIVDLVSQYVDLKRVGSNFQGLCPFHDEKTPSFNVNPERQIFHCFGCGEGGNAFTFIINVEGVSFPEAVRTLGKRVGVEVEERRIPVEQRSRNEAMYQANVFAARFYHRCLVESAEAKVAREYLEGRGIDAAAWKRFGIGFAPPAWDRLFNAARREGIRNEVLVQLRLIVARERGTGYFDYFRERIMFPIVIPGGRVVAFGARAMGDAEPKYLNSTESPVFAKRRTFYGLDQAQEALRRERRAVVVEGYTDLISLHLHGFRNAVATCGTALTSEHAKGLRRLTRKVVLLPDGDSAGENAAVASGSVLLAAGLDVAVARLGKGEDPDSAAREQGPEKMTQLIDGSMDYFDYLAYIVNERGMSPREREGLIRRVVSGLSDLEDRLRYEVITGELASALDMDVAAIREQRRRPARRSAEEQPAAEPVEDPTRLALEKTALRLVQEGTPLALEALDSLDVDDFSNPDNRKLYNLLDSARQSRIDMRSHEFQRHAEEADLAGLAAEIALIPLPPGNIEALLKDTIRKIKELKIRDELTVLREKLMHLPSDSEEAVALGAYYQTLKQALVEL